LSRKTPDQSGVFYFQRGKVSAIHRFYPTYASPSIARQQAGLAPQPEAASPEAQTELRAAARARYAKAGELLA
jgi:hypothetical protein